MKKEYPVVWCEAKFKNTSDMPMNIGIEWQLSNRFERYLSVDKNIYDMPRKIVGMEMTQHLMSKENWQSIGITPFDKWIYFLPKSGADGLGVFMITRKDETSFWGVRQDLLPYWGEKRKILEENGFLSSKFILIPAKSEKEFIDVLDRIKERR
jgi:hypothetical protein